MDSEAQPYVGPRPFKREDAPFFFGRDREANELRSLIISHSEVLFYAQSGAGKTSLINAKLSKLLEDDDLEVLPVASVKGPQPTFKVANTYVFNTLASWKNKSDTVDDATGMTLREFLESRKPLLDEEGLPKPCVAIFDQFEELFTSHPECWEQRRDFFVQVRDALDALPHLRALFAMREDYVAAIDPYASIMPEKFRVRFHLENLRKDQAIEAIEGPLSRGQKIHHFGEGVAETLANELMKVQVKAAGGRAEPITGEFVEPVQLQVVCQRLWRDLKPEDTEITLAHLKTISVEKALLSFYEESIRDVARSTETDEATLRSWFEQKLVTPAGTRGMVFRGETQTEGMPNKAVDALDKLHVIRSELRGGAAQWYELTHDRFIDAIQKSREKLLQNLQAGAEETSKKLEARADEWLRLGEKRSGLLSGNELDEAERWIEGPAAKVLRPTERLRSLVATSRAEVQMRSARRRKRWIYALGIACLVALLTAAFAWGQTLKANRKTSESNRLREEAKVDNSIIFGRNLAARALKYKNSKLDLTLLLALEASRIAGEIDPKTPAQAEARTSLLAEAKGGLLAGLVFSPHLRTFFHGPNGLLRCVAFSPDGKMVAAGGVDQKIFLWRLSGYQVGLPLAGHTDTIYGLSFSPDSKKLASCGGDGDVIVWDLDGAKATKVLSNVGHALFSVAFSPDGKTLACSGTNGRVYVCDVEGSRVARTLSGHEGDVYCVTFNPSGDQVAAGGADRKILFWDISSSKLKRSLEDSNQVLCVAFSPDGTKLAAGNRDFNVTLWNVIQGKGDVAKREEPMRIFKGHENSVSGVAFTPDGVDLISGSPDKTLRRWDVDSGKQIGEAMTGSNEQVYAVGLNKDGETVVSGGDNGAVVLWNTTNQPLAAKRIPLLTEATSVVVSPDNKTLVVGHSNGHISVISETAYDRFLAHQHKVTSLAFSPDGKTLASASSDGSIQLRSWDGKTWNSAPRSLPTSNKPVNSIAFSSNNMLASGGDDGVLFWDLTTDKPLGSPLKHGNAVTSIAFSRDGKMLASGSDDWTVGLWDVARRELLKPLLVGHSYDVSALAFSPDGKMLASGGGDTAVIFWDVATHRMFNSPFRAHTGYVDSLAFSPNGNMLASCSAMDRSVILWDVATREPIGPLLTEDKYPINAVAFTPDGRLVSASWGVTLWDVDLKSLRSKADEVASRNFTLDERERFLENHPYRPTSLHGLLKEADSCALRGDVQQARNLFKQVVEIATKDGDATLNNRIGWYGSLDGMPDITLPACDRAVALAKDEDKPEFRDSRGLARATLGRIPEAIEDFEAYLASLKSEQEKEKTQQSGSLPSERAERREGIKKIQQKREKWILSLKSGHNPFDKSTLMSLRREGASE